MTKNYLKPIQIFFLCLALTVLSAGCRYTDGTWSADDRLKVMTTLFPYYDFVRSIAGDTVELKLLLPVGQESHSFEPTPADMIDIQKSDLFIYNGGESEYWADRVLHSLESSDIKAAAMMDSVPLLEEIQDETHTHDEEEVYDEHIWTSPANAITIVTELCRILKEAAPQYADLYESNAAAYIEQLSALDNKFRDLASQAGSRPIVVGDKFPFLYLVREYGFSYQAAFAGCSHDTEPSVQAMTELIHSVKDGQIPVVYYLELSSHQTASAIAEAGGAQIRLLHSCHNLSAKEWSDGATYLSLMEQNLANLKEGLCS